MAPTCYLLRAIDEVLENEFFLGRAEMRPLGEDASLQIKATGTVAGLALGAEETWRILIRKISWVLAHVN